MHRLNLAPVNERPSPDLHVDVYPFLEVDIANVVAAFEVPSKTCHPPNARMPMSILDTQPPSGNKIIYSVIEIVDETHLAILWGGRLWAYRQRFEENGISGTQLEAEYVRIVNEEDGDMDEDENKTRIVDAFGDKVLKNHIVKVTVDGEIDEGTAAGKAVTEILDLPNVIKRDP